MGKVENSTQDRQALILWALLGKDHGACFQNELRPEPARPDRVALEKSGLITSEKRSRRLWIEVTEKGWAWAADHLDHSLPARSLAGAIVLQAWLARLKAYLRVREVTLAEVLSPGLPKPTRSESHTPNDNLPPLAYDDLHRRIREAYLSVTHNRLNTRARLSGIRDLLTDIDRDALDAALIRMQHEQLAVLYPLDNHVDITEADRQAAIYFVGEPRHILWIEQ